MGRILLRIISIGLTISFHLFLQILFVESLSLVGWIHFIDCRVNAYQSGFSFYGVLVLMYYSFDTFEKGTNTFADPKQFSKRVRRIIVFQGGGSEAYLR